VVEFEQTEIRSLNPHQAAANELVGYVGDFLVETNNLLVDLRAVDSRLATEDDEEGLAGAPGLGFGGVVVAVPAELVGVAFALSERGRGREKHQAATGQEMVHGWGLRYTLSSG
jgi:hypothetical protein